MKHNEIEKLVKEPLNLDNAETAAEVYANEALWPAFESALYAGAELTADDRNTIGRFVDEHCKRTNNSMEAELKKFVATRLERISGNMGDFALAAARRDGDASAEKAHDDEEPVTFVFVSEPNIDDTGAQSAWRAELVLPPNAAVDEMLPIRLVNASGDTITGGTFSIAGVSLPVADGRAEVPYGMFLSGLKDARVELVTAAGAHLPGTLALF